MRTLSLRLSAVAGVAALVLAACGSDDSAGDAASDESSGGAGDLPTVVVTTNVLGDVVDALVGDQAEVVTIMKVGSDPHVFQPSAQEVNQMQQADVLIVNGAGFEAAMDDVVDAVESDGVPTHEAISAVSNLIEYGSDDHDGEDHEGEEAHEDEEAHDDDEEEHDDEDEETHEDHEEEAGHDGHDHGDVDPHFYLDPARMAESVEGMSAFFAENLDGIDVAALEQATTDYLAELDALDATAEDSLSGPGADQRKLVTNHDALSYFADRYDLEVVGTVIPAGLTTGDAASPADVAELAAVIEEEGVPAIFTDFQAADNVAEALADEVGHDVEIVALYTGSLGDADSGADTYLAMIETNVELVAGALG